MTLSIHARRTIANRLIRGGAAAISLALSSAISLADWPNTNLTKWVEYPNETPSGYDVMMRQPYILASDFLCTNTGPITDIHIWTSYQNDIVPSTNLVFTLSFWSDLPAGSLGTNYSRPNLRLWTQPFSYPQYQVRSWRSNLTERFINAELGTNGIIGADTSIWQYNFYPTNPFVQQGNTAAPTTYWLSVNVTGLLGITNIGWKTSTNYWNDDSVFARVSGTTLTTSWQPIVDPTNTQISLDLSFALTTTNQFPPPPPTTNTDKWLQVPDTSFNGLDVRATSPKILASDFLCKQTGPITQLRFWASWNNDMLPPVPPCFCIGIWSDIPGGPGNPSHPGQIICSNCFNQCQYTYFPYTNCVNEQFWDPNTGQFLGFDTTIWEYIFNWPTNQACYQTNGNIYWVSLSADCFDQGQYQFGWKTCPTNWNDDSVYGDAPFGFGPPFWTPLVRPGTNTSLDLAFEVFTATNPPPPVPPPTPTNAVDKWFQPPDTSFNGLDVKATDPKILASDFLCTNTGPISQIRIWGSWLNDMVPPFPPCFCLGIWNDQPAGPTGGFSSPRNLLCSSCFYQCQYTYFPYTNCVNEGFYDPNINQIIGSDKVIWEFIFDWPTNNPCYQTNGNVYWVSLAVDCLGANANYVFGWKTCATNWNDDSVYGDAPFGSTPPFWLPLIRPGTNTSLDLAFEVITRTNGQPPPPPPTDTNKWFQIPDTSTNGIDVRATTQKILADDFRCTATGPITEIRFWTSWLNNIVDSNACFCLGIWNDIPQVGTNYSRPGQQLCNWCFFPGQYSQLLYTNVPFERFWDPNLGTNGFLGFDTQIWEYRFQIPTNNPACIQTNGNIYWVSLTADCLSIPEAMFGWKTCPTNFNDDAVYGDGPFGGGPPTTGWFPLVRPFTTNSLDLSFKIITGTNPCAPPTIGCPPNKTVQCGTLWPIDVPVVTDPCCGALYSLTYTAVTNTGFCPQIITFTWTMSDCVGVTLYCTQVVTVVDTIAPSITCATNKTVQCSTNWSFDLPTATDLCCGTNVALIVVANTTNFSGCTGTFTRAWQAVDCCSNYSTICTQIVTVTDTIPPVLTCATNKTIQCGSPLAFDTPTAFDACCLTNVSVVVLSTVTNPLPCTNFSCLVCTGLVTRTWQAIDCCSNFTTCSQTITVLMTNAPVMVCASNKTVLCGVPWNFDPPTATCCGSTVAVSVASTTTNGCLFTRFWSAQGCCSTNAAVFCSQTVTLLDTNKPTIICPSNIVVYTCSTNIAVAWSIVATDSCTSVTVTSAPPSGSLFNRGSTNTVIATATDACGNTNSCSFLVIVRRPSLFITLGHGTPPTNVVITWQDGGILQDATNLLGSWTDHLLATSPYTNDISAKQKFYRIRCP